MAMACSRCSRSSCMIAATGRPQWAHTPCVYFFLFFFNDTATTEIYTLSLHDALPICHVLADVGQHHLARDDEEAAAVDGRDRAVPAAVLAAAAGLHVADEVRRALPGEVRGFLQRGQRGPRRHRGVELRQAHARARIGAPPC